MRTVEYQLFDADIHYYETRDAFTRHIEPKYRDRAIEVGIDPESGHDQLLIGGQPFTFLPRAPIRDRSGPRRVGPDDARRGRLR
ncbi:MAG TPA: hypothetical protein VM282_01725 [Acidimicrobiales bacterium]|nr:hypothetical protein [Acidimicrobiales bacterium]